MKYLYTISVLLLFSTVSLSKPLDNCDNFLYHLDTTNNVAFARQIMQELRHSVDASCKARMTIVEGVLLNLEGDPTLALEWMRKGVDEARSAGATKEEVYGLHQQVNILLDQNKVKEAEEILKETRAIMESENAEYGWVAYFDKNARIASMLGRHYDNIRFQDSIIINQLFEDSVTLTNTIHNVGAAYLDLSDYEKASEYFLKAVSINKRLKGGDLVANFLFLGHTYTLWERYDTAENYLEAGLELARKEGRNSVVPKLLTTLASTLNKKGELEAALNAVNEAIKSSKEYASDFEMARMYIEKARILKMTEGYSENVKATIDQSYSYAQQSHALSQFAPALELGSYYLHNSNTVMAKKYMDEIAIIIRETNNAYHIQSYEQLLSEFHEAQGEYAAALTHYKNYYKIEDSIASARVLSEVAVAERKYDSQQKAIDIIKLNEMKERQALEIRSSKKLNTVYLLLAGILGLSIMGLVFFLSKLKKKQLQLASNNRKLEEINQVKNRLFSVIAHDVRSMIFPFRRASKVLKHHVKKGNYNRVETLSNELEKNANNISVVLDNLLEWSLHQMEGYQINHEELNIKEEFQSIFNVFTQHASEKKVQLQLNENENDNILFDKGAFHVIFRNLIANAIKFTENGTVDINWHQKDTEMVFNVTDTGVGMAAEQIESYTQTAKVDSTGGTQGEKGSGLGLNLVRQFVEKMQGNIHIKSLPHDGTSFTLIFPNKTASA